MKMATKKYSQNSLQIRFLTWLQGEFMGEDAFGNRYYQERLLFGKPQRPLRRWVLYSGAPDPTAVPPIWFGWLHFTNEHPLTDHVAYPWEKAHTPNMTGTSQAYFPPETASTSKESSTQSGKFKPWKPSE